jgi:endoglycosylceramidase
MPGVIMTWRVAAAAAVLACCAAAAAISVNERQRLVDGAGREVFFHGANMVAKGPPYLPERRRFNAETSFVAQDMALFQALGLNAVRLGNMWDGAEPRRGHYNASYHRELAAIVAEARGYGIYSLIDMHQDVMSPKFCGEGFPGWAAQANTTNFPYPLRAAPFNVSKATGVPTGRQCGDYEWGLYYPTQATGEAFQNLYDNYDGLRDAWAAFWRRTAAVMKPLGDAVLGYELMNEPWAGDVIRDPLLLVPGVADRKNLAKMWAVGAAAIRAVDAEHAIFFEAVTWDDFGVGFAEVPGGAAWQNKSVLSYHYYAPPDVGSPAFELAVRLKDLKRLGCGGMLTEFGLPRAGVPRVSPERVMAAADAAKQSWLFWQYKAGTHTLWTPAGEVNRTTAAIVSRTYPQAVAGATGTMHFDPATGAFRLTYTVVPGVRSNATVVFVPAAYHYPAGVKVTATAVVPSSGAAVAVRWNRTSTTAVVVTHSSTAPMGTVVTVSITNSA